MSLANKVLAVNNDLPIRTDSPVHSGKVRSVYWLTEADSRRLIEENVNFLESAQFSSYDHEQSSLAVESKPFT